MKKWSWKEKSAKKTLKLAQIHLNHTTLWSYNVFYGDEKWTRNEERHKNQVLLNVWYCMRKRKSMTRYYLLCVAQRGIYIGPFLNHWDSKIYKRHRVTLSNRSILDDLKMRRNKIGSWRLKHIGYACNKTSSFGSSLIRVLFFVDSRSMFRFIMSG